MTTTAAPVLLRHLRTLVASEQADGPSDRQLLEQFVQSREEEAFETVVRRHAPLVLGVCRRVLRNEADAEDAFQATFLVLARKARDVGRTGSVAGWLHRVAFHAAIKARSRSASRDAHERRTPPRHAADALAVVTGRELLTVLDEELQRLSDECRTSLVLCYLEGHTCDDAARRLGCSVRTLKRRLEQARRLLRGRLARRGIALPAAMLTLGLTQSAKAALPSRLVTATVEAAASTGAAATTAGLVADAVIRSSSAPRLRGLAALLLVGTLTVVVGLMAHQVQAQRPGTLPQALPAPPAEPVKDPAEAKKTALAGRVLDTDGKPIAGAQVTAYGGLDLGRLSVERREKAFDVVKTDEKGRFRLPLPDVSGHRLDRIRLLAGARGYGPAWVNASAERAEVELRLPPEAAVVGRLIDLQGQPVVGAKLRPVRVLGEVPPALGIGKLPEFGAEAIMAKMKRFEETRRRQQGFEFAADSPLKDSSLWPITVKSDADGRFRLGGFGRGQEVHLRVEDDTVAAQEIAVEAGAKERTFSLLPPHKLTGLIRAADTDKPVAGASVWVTSYRQATGRVIGADADGRTDADGRFSINATPGESYAVTVYPPRGESYLAASRSGDWAKGAVRQTVDFKLSRGVVLRGKVVEASSGKALVSATVQLVPQRDNNPELPSGDLAGPMLRVFTGDDGTFRMVVPPGRGHLLVTGPNAEYTYDSITQGELQAGKAGGTPQHFHAVRALELRLKEEPKEVKVELRRAVTIKGRVVGPDGKAVENALVFVPRELAPPSQQLGLAKVLGLPPDVQITAVQVRDGVFELSNCDLEKSYRVFVLSGKVQGEGLRWVPGGISPEAVVNRLIAAKGPLGAAATLSAAEARGKPVEVKLAECTTGEVRFVDAEGKPVPQKVWLELVVKSNPTEAALLATPYSLTGETSPVAPDADGRITLPGLISGATYRLQVRQGEKFQENEVVFEKEFTVEAGKPTKLQFAAPENR